MNSNFKYLPHNPEDAEWGVHLTVAGSACVEPGSAYPPDKHPKGYHFNWDNGRMLQEYQLNYITEGEGIMETKDDRFAIKEGSIILLHPNTWHRYKPLVKTGWVEHCVGFSGEVARKMIQSSIFFSKESVLKIGFHDKILHLFNEIVEQVKNEKPGFQQISAGLVVQILGQIISIKRNKDFEHGPMEQIIRKACLIIHDSPTKNINIEQLSDQLNVNYSLFRKSFKKYTGLSPLQYHTSLRMKQAEYLLTNTDMRVKEISYELGFCSEFYFSKLFKEKTNKTPGEYRKMLNWSH